MELVGGGNGGCIGGAGEATVFSITGQSIRKS